MIPRDNNLKLPNKDNTTDTCIASFSMPIMMVYPFLLTMKTKCSIPLNCFLGDILTIDSWFTPLNTIPYSHRNISRYFYSIIDTKNGFHCGNMILSVKKNDNKLEIHLPYFYIIMTLICQKHNACQKTITLIHSGMNICAKRCLDNAN